MERSWRSLEPKKVSLEASWSRLVALKIASRWPEGDRREVDGRWVEQVWLALALGSATIKEYRLKTTTLYAGSEHAMGQRPGELYDGAFGAPWDDVGDILIPSWVHFWHVRMTLGLL